MSNKNIITIGVVAVVAWFVLLIACGLASYSVDNANVVKAVKKTTTIKPTTTPTRQKETKTVEPMSSKTIQQRKYLNAEKYSLLMKENVIQYVDQPLEEITSYIKRIFNDDLKLIKKDVIKSNKNDYFISKYKCNDNSILILHSEKNFCIAYDWERGINKKEE